MNQLESAHYQIRPLTTDDLPQLLALELQVTQFPWSEKAHQDGIEQGYPSLVLMNNDKLIGFVIFNFYVDECHLLNLAIAPDYQGQGLAKVLLNKLFSIAAQEQMQQIILEVRSSNLAAIRLYQQQGFEKIGLRKNYYKGNSRNQYAREDAIVMKLLLT